ncbi:glycoside hydrolase family 105 protein [Endozoicomonas sp. SESOKO1]|uniref:glycoside hydrolase family 88/105 protein n=1 Tax=Endozoicomonas sp. SESOKO1 TaxID=2828742 RepID=UPI0021491001|nr:glycoside hydrolase family 88 protein [Endozoicomonas sp. SESOKO1]
MTEQKTLPAVFDHAEAVKLMRMVCDWQLANPTKSWIRRSGATYYIKGTDWERGVMYTGVMATWRATDDSKYLDAAINWAKDNQWKVGPEDRFADDHTCCQTYLEIYQALKDDAMKESSIEAFDLMLKDPKPGREDWWWCDSLFMAPPAFAMLTELTGEPKYLDAMNTLWWDSVDHLLDPETGLFFRDKRYIPDGQGGELREENGEKVFWGRGNGWVVSAICRVLDHMPEDYADRQKYIDLFVALCEAVVKLQGDDGFWRASMLDPKSFPSPESSATSLFAHGMAWGINNGILDRDAYMPALEKAWAALKTCVHEDGMMGWIQLPAFNPRDTRKEHNIDYGAGTFLLAAEEVARLCA